MIAHAHNMRSSNIPLRKSETTPKQQKNSLNTVSTLTPVQADITSGSRTKQQTKPQLALSSPTTTSNIICAGLTSCSTPLGSERCSPGALFTQTRKQQNQKGRTKRSTTRLKQERDTQTKQKKNSTPLLKRTKQTEQKASQNGEKKGKKPKVAVSKNHHQTKPLKIKQEDYENQSVKALENLLASVRQLQHQKDTEQRQRNSSTSTKVKTIWVRKNQWQLRELEHQSRDL